MKRGLESLSRRVACCTGKRCAAGRGERGFVMMVLLLAALCAFLLLAMIADMQLLAHVQNLRFLRQIRKRIADEHITVVVRPESTPAGAVRGR